MAKITFRDSTIVGDYEKPYIVAELNTSHNGNPETARHMIDAAHAAGISCVKFQSWSAESLYSKTYYDQNPVAKRVVQKFSFGEPELADLARYCREKGIAFSSTPYSKREVDFLLECGAPFIKIASMELNNIPFLEYIARTGAPMVLSTGMGGMEEIRNAVEAIRNTGNHKLCLLHCISIYPAEAVTIRLNNIVGLRKAFPDCAIGFSDHSLGIEMATAAVALGAALIEKHLTLDNKKIGMDNGMATEPAEFAQLVRNCNNVHAALGDETRIVPQAELEQRKKMRRSVVVTRDLKAGTKLTSADLDAKRPGTGLPPEQIRQLIGKVLARDVTGDTLLTEADLSA